ncbi:MAG: hypothetical protein K9M44_03695 [Candidatus Pacebacteria bacterium]|nr:hypothetical protein [Candidatus Paceibacterota bacterium]
MGGTKPRPLKPNKIDYKSLSKPLEGPDSVCKWACSQCGVIREINLDYAQALLQLVHIIEDKEAEFSAYNKEYFKRKYFVSSNCKLCKSLNARDFFLELKSLNDIN